MKVLIDREDGMTVRDLRKLLSKLIEIDEDGNEPRIYVACGNLHTSPLKIAALDEDGDIVLIPDFWQAVMDDVNSWDDFICQ